MGSPYRLELPAAVSFSGGRTSGLMLRSVLDAFGGCPDGLAVTFQNTGREDERTLRFVDRVSREWAVPIRWLEYRRLPGPVTTDGRTVAVHGWREVTFETASRDGEPFAELIGVMAEFRASNRLPPVLPNVPQRWCSAQLKIRTQRRFIADELGWQDYTVAIGMRADEPKRVANLPASDKLGTNGTVAITHVAPLAKTGVTEADVMTFWGRQPFDLELAHDPLHGTYEGNCDGCFLKSADKIKRLARERPGMAAWWAEQERRTGRTFRTDRFTYQDVEAGRVNLMTADERQPDLFTCFCTD